MNLLGDVFAAIMVGALFICALSVAVIVFATLATYTYQSVVWALSAVGL
jgi:hypothetical protein